MAIEFVVGRPEKALGEEAGRSFCSLAAAQFAWAPVGGAEEPYYSEQLSWSGCLNLCRRASAEIGAASCAQLGLLAQFSTVFLPVVGLHTSIKMSPRRSLNVGSVPDLAAELDRFARALDLPTEHAAVDAYWQRDEYGEDEGDDIETYCHLRLAVSEALRRGQPLWAVS
jgi:hypothetical protein